MGTGYTGHGRSGGVQVHSMGELYPYTIIAQGDPNRCVQWRAMDMRSGSEGPPRPTYKLAEMDVHSARLRNMMHQ